MRPDRKTLLIPFLLLPACTSPQAEVEDGEYQIIDSAPQLVDQEPEQYEATPSGAAAAAEAKRQKNALMAQNYVAMGNDAFERGDYVGAGVHYAEASRLDPTSVAARDGMRRSQLAAADQPYDIDSSEDVLAQSQRRHAANRMRVEGLVREGDLAMGQGDFATAVDRYSMSIQALGYSPNLAYGLLDTNLVQAKLDEATAARMASDQAQRAADAEAAAADAEAAVEARRTYRENLLARHFEEANEQFANGFPGDAVETLDGLLRLDPGNPEATQLRAVALEAYHFERGDRIAAGFAEEWKKAFEELRHMTAPPSENFGYDEKYWDETVGKRKPLDQVDVNTEVDPVEASIRAALANTQLVPNFDDTLEEIVPNLQSYTKVNFVISRAVRDDIDEDIKTIRLSLKQPMAVDSILRIMEDLMGGEVKFVIRSGVVQVLTTEEADTESTTRQYEVRDIVRPVKDFPLKEFNLTPSGGIDAEEEEMPEPEATIIGDDDLLTMITETIDPDSWDEVNSANIENGTLIVHHRPDVQAEVAQMLEDLRVPANIMVHIRVRFMRVEDSFLQDVGIDFRGLGNDSTSGAAGKGDDKIFNDFGTDYGSPGSPGRIGTGNDSGMIFTEANSTLTMLGRSENLYDTSLGGGSDGLEGSGGLALQYTWLDDLQLEMILRAVRKSKRSELVVEPSLMVYNTARANLVVANQVSYVSDFDVQIASSAAIADPIVRVAHDGVYLDVRPVVSADRRFVWVDVRPTVANLKRPIPSLQTSLGVGTPVTLMLPELELQKIRTRALLPDGGTLLLGGMNVIKEQDLVTGIPFLSQVPVLSFFFSRKGTYESYQKLIILLTADIILPDEREPETLPVGF